MRASALFMMPCRSESISLKSNRSLEGNRNISCFATAKRLRERHDEIAKVFLQSQALSGFLIFVK